MNDESEYCLRWHRHLTNFIESFDNLLENESLADVYFFAEGQLVKAHKVVLSSCSTYFQSLFKETIERHPIIVLKDVKLAHIKALLEFMYRGTVNVPQDSLEPIMKMAQSLNIKGLADGIVNIEKVEPEEENDHPMSLIRPKSSNNYGPSTAISSESSCIRPFPSLYNKVPSSVNNVLSSALSVPSALSLTSHLTLPQLASLPPNIASTLASTLSNAIPPSIASFIPPRDIPNRENSETPLTKRRRKHRRRSGETLDSGDSDGRSSGSPGESNLHFPKIPATITPVGLHRQSMQQFPNNSLPQQQPRDLSMHSSNNHSNSNDRQSGELSRELQLRELREQRERSNFIKNASNIPGLLLHPPMENHKTQDEPENLELRPSQISRHEKVEAKTESIPEYSNHRRSESPNCDKSSPATSGNRSDGSSGTTTRQSPKCGSDPDSLISPVKASLPHSRLDETSSDNNHYSDDEREDNNGPHREHANDRVCGTTPGPSTSRPQSEEAPSTPSKSFLGWPYTSEANSNEENFPNFPSDTNQDYFRALNFVRAGFSGILPPRMSSEIYSRSSVPIGLPLLLKSNNEMPTNQRNLLGYSFPETPKQYTCEKCGRSYASTGNLKRHKKYECGVEPQFSCPICKKKFQHRHSVKIHVFSTHRNEAGESGSDATRDSLALFSTPDGVSSVGPGGWQIPTEASTTASQNQEG